MKTWQEPPTKIEVRSEIATFFELLGEGKLEQARLHVAHKFEDWESQIWSLWQDTYLVYLEELDKEVEDDSFEGKLWLRDTAWLHDLGIDEILHSENSAAPMAAYGAQVFVNLTYKGELLDVSASFSIAQQKGGLCVMRESIRIT